ncbi:MAG: pantetheine-phosphate adenylyltransferase [Prevotella sp.]|nr:pantetheine-phosphate adenylyltransferase [Prevotella sp.]
MKKAFFAGSFDPFTIGHASVVERALKVFDRVVIGIGNNAGKHYSRTTEERKTNIESIYSGDKRVEVMVYDGLTVDAVRACGADVIVKGTRSVADFESERTQADINRELTGVETVLFIAEPGLASVSSTMVRELEHNGVDVGRFLPKKK